MADKVIQKFHVYDFNNDGWNDVIRRVEEDVVKETSSKPLPQGARDLGTVTHVVTYRPELKIIPTGKDEYIPFDTPEVCGRKGEYLPPASRPVKFVWGYGKSDIPFYGKDKKSPFFVGQRVALKDGIVKEIKAFKVNVFSDVKEVTASKTTVLLSDCSEVGFGDISPVK